MFEFIKKLRPYFFSLREIDNNVSLDIKLPVFWRYDEIVKPYRLVKTKIQDKNDKFFLLSLVSTATQEGYDVVFSCALEIVLLNKEEEEKQRLLQEKIKELELLFKKESLDRLKEINFNNTYGQEIDAGFGLVEQGDGKRQEGDRDPQNEDDRGD